MRKQIAWPSPCHHPLPNSGASGNDAWNNDDHVDMQALKYLKGSWLKNYLGT